MLIQKAFKTELSPNNKQRTFFERSAGTARFAWNWGLGQRISLYTKEKKSLTAKEAVSLKQEINTAPTLR